MKIILFAVIAFCGMIPSNSRLIQKNTDKTTPELHTDSTLRTRIARALSEEDTVTGYSKEYDHSNEAMTNAKKSKPLFRPKPLSRHAKKVVRVARDSTDSPKKVTEAPRIPIKSKVAVVKKPIPKFNEIDYDDDFQMKVIRSAMKYADSGEHEDEDFNLDDYDFDVNHDEFAGRGKPLEPRIKIKNTREEQNAETSTPKPEPPLPPAIKIQSKVVIPSKVKNLNKRNNVYEPKKAADKTKYDYYDDVATSTRAAREYKKSEFDDDLNEENEESKEYEHKSLRSVRSPWMKDLITNKLGEKTVGIFGRIMSMLPMFPQPPRRQH